VSAFGEDEDGELYLACLGVMGELHRLVPAASPTPELTVVREGSGIGQVTDPDFTFEGYFGHADCADGTITLSADRACKAIFGAGFTDDPLVNGETIVRAVHLTELRARINTLRSDLGLAAETWTDETLEAGATTAKAVHFTEMRTALDEAYTAVPWPLPSYTDAALGPGTPVRATHVMELRAAVVALEAI
jgi:hypothetical protein